MVTISHRLDLRSNNSIVLEIPKANLISCGNRAFSKAALVLWNGLTPNFRNTQKFYHVEVSDMFLSDMYAVEILGLRSPV